MSTVLRGNSNVTRCTVIVLKRPSSAGLCKWVEEFFKSEGAAGEQAGLELVAFLKSHLDAMQPEL